MLENLVIDVSSSEIKSQAQPHHGKQIYQAVISSDMSYFVTYSKEDNSILGWQINFEKEPQQPDVDFPLGNPEENGPQQPNVNLPLGKPYQISSFILHKKILLFYYKINEVNYHHYYRIIDLNYDKGQFLELKHSKIDYVGENSMGFLPNGDLILVSLKDYEIYLYSSQSKPSNSTTPWKYSQKYEIEIPKSLNVSLTNKDEYIDCYVCQTAEATKLFISTSTKFNEYESVTMISQWDLSKMTFDMQYNLSDSYKTEYFNKSLSNIVINKNQTLLALNIKEVIYVFSMKSGILISKYSDDYEPVEFVTLDDGFEGLIIYNKLDKLCKFIDPFLPSDILIDITNIINDPRKNIITKSNRNFSIIENNVHIIDGLKEDSFQLLNWKTYHGNIYTLPIFKTIQDMLIKIKNNDISKMDEIGLAAYGNLFRFKYINHHDDDLDSFLEIIGIKNQNNEETQNYITHKSTDILSYQGLNNQDLALITKRGIFIYTIYGDLLSLRYFWNNEEWEKVYKQGNGQSKSSEYEQDSNGYKNLIEKVLNSEFSECFDSLPSPNFKVIFEIYDENNLSNSYDRSRNPFNIYKNFLSNIIINENPVEFSRFGKEILKIAIKKNNDYIVKLIFDKIIKFIENDETNHMMLLPAIISSNLPKLCDHNHYSYLVVKYILYTSIIFDSTCLSFKNSENASLYAYSKNIHIKKSNNYFNYFKSSQSFNPNQLKIQQKISTISFIVLFPEICKYPEDNHYYNSWNEFLYKPNSIIFCNIDPNYYYKWWNFAAIINFKWNNFGRYYYCWIWFFYTIFFLCFALASSLVIPDFYRMILFIISIILGLIHLIIEFRQLLWNPIFYINDAWNFFDVAAYSLPIITSIYWLILGESPPFNFISAISNLLLNFKFLLFFRVKESFGIYFAIIIGVAWKVFSFLMILLFIITGFAHAFYILLRSTSPWDLTASYNSVNSNETILLQQPDSNTNMFNWFPTSLLAMYLFLTGDSGSLSSWTYRESPAMTIMLALFTFFTVIYLMNLFIGLLNIAIEDYNKYDEFLLQKAKIIAEIELFYMTSHQRQKNCSSDWIYYDISVNDVNKLINAIDDNKSEFSYPLFISKKLRELIGIPIPKDLIDEHKNDKLEMLVKEDVEKSFKLIKKLADKGNVISQFNLAIAYYHGKNTEKNSKEAFNLFQKVVKTIDSLDIHDEKVTGKNSEQTLKYCYKVAMNLLAICYKNGEGTEKNLKLAFNWHQKAAENGNNKALHNLALCYQNGKGTEKNSKEAFNCYQKAAENGEESAMNNLAICYENGEGTEKNFKEAFKWYQKAAKNGLKEAMNNLARLYHNDKETGKNLEEALNWYEKAAKNGNIDAMNNLAMCYEKGEGTGKNLKEKAFNWYQKAAKNGLKEAMSKLAACYHFGRGTEKNLEMAFNWYQKAAENGYERAINNLNETERNLEDFNWYQKAVKNGNEVAMNNLAICYEKGEGTERNLKEAFNWYQKAAENGNKISMYNLGECYELGNGVDKNKVKAFEWYKKSAEPEDLSAKFYLGYCYINGIGTKINKEKGFELYNEAAGKKINDIQNKFEDDDEIVNDLDKVNYWYHKAAENDNKVALYKLGEFYESGRGVHENKARAFEFYKKSAELEFIDAQYKVGYYYDHGIVVDANKEIAFNLYEIAAKEGNCDAQKNLALLYKQGEGTEKNIEKAIYWYKKAVEMDEEEESIVK